MEIRAEDLVRAAMAATGATGPAELARKLELAGYDSPKRVSRWLNGENKPRFDETIGLLRLAGWLSETRVRAAGLAEARRAAERAAQEARALADRERPARGRRKSP